MKIPENTHRYYQLQHVHFDRLLSSALDMSITTFILWMHEKVWKYTSFLSTIMIYTLWLLAIGRTGNVHYHYCLCTHASIWGYIPSWSTIICTHWLFAIRCTENVHYHNHFVRAWKYFRIHIIIINYNMYMSIVAINYNMYMLIVAIRCTGSAITTFILWVYENVCEYTPILPTMFYVLAIDVGAWLSVQHKQFG